MDADAKALPMPPSRAVIGRSNICKFIYMYKNIFLKQEKSEMDDFAEEEKNFSTKGKILLLTPIVVFLGSTLF